MMRVLQDYLRSPIVIFNLLGGLAVWAMIFASTQTHASGGAAYIPEGILYDAAPNVRLVLEDRAEALGADYVLQDVRSSVTAKGALYVALIWNKHHGFGHLFEIYKKAKASDPNAALEQVPWEDHADRYEFKQGPVEAVYGGEPPILFVTLRCVAADPHCTREHALSFGDRLESLNYGTSDSVYRYEDIDEDGASEAISVELYWSDLYWDCATCGPRPRSIWTRKNGEWEPACDRFASFYTRYSPTERLLEADLSHAGDFAFAANRALELANAARFEESRAVYDKLIDALQTYSGEHPWMGEPNMYLTPEEHTTPFVEGTKRIIGTALDAAEARMGTGCALRAPNDREFR